jgi:two-component system OmpR family response regulator
MADPATMRILVVEDDPTLAEFVAKGLTEAGHVVDLAPDGHAALERAGAVPPDLAVVDLMLPKLDGLSLIENWRRRGLRFPVLILSARRTVDDRVKGLQIGGDDYLTKPFAFAELLARVEALLRRQSGAAEPTELQVGDLSIDLLSRRVTRAGRRIALRPREYALLEYLARHAGQVVSKTMILSRVWNYRFDPRTNIVDVLVHRLREKIDADFDTRLLHTRRGMGYVLGPELDSAGGHRGQA